MRLKRLGVCALVVLAVFAMAGVCSAQVGGGGNSAGYLLLKLDDLDERLVGAGFNEMPKGMFTWGGYAIGEIGDGKWSIGILGRQGSATSRASDGSPPKTASLQVGYGGLLVQYNVWRSDKASLGIGAVLGGGSATLTTKRGAIADFDDLLDAANSASLWRPYLMAQPQASIAFPLSALIDVRIAGGYSFLYAPTGWFDGVNFKNPIDGPLKTMGLPFIEVGIAFGGPAGGPIGVPVDDLEEI